MAGSKKHVGAGRIVADSANANTPVEAIKMNLKMGRSGPNGLRSVVHSPGEHPGLADLGLQTLPFAPGHARRKPGVGPHRMVSLGPTPSNMPSGPAMRRGRIDAHLARVVDAWATLPPRVREAIMAMIDAAAPGTPSNVPPPK